MFRPPMGAPRKEVEKQIMKIKITAIVVFILCILCIPLINLNLGASPNNLQENDFFPSSSNTLSGGESVSVPLAEALGSYGDISFTILDLSSQKVFTVSADEYALGAVMAEIPPTYHTEAIKAQAVSAVTYALYKQQKNAENPDPALNGADFSVDIQNHLTYVDEATAKEMYGDLFSIYYSKMKQACQAVSGQLVLYENEPILAAYHAISMGYTESSENVWEQSLPYLTPQESFGDRLAAGYTSHETYTHDQLCAAFAAQYPDFQTPAIGTEWIQVLSRSDSGTVLQAKVSNLTLTGREIRELLSLRSANFEVTFSGQNILLTVYGYGHSVGLSQNGADFMARQGKTYVEILEHYYYPATVQTLPE